VSQPSDDYIRGWRDARKDIAKRLREAMSRSLTKAIIELRRLLDELEGEP
jgi:hypothetical protein